MKYQKSHCITQIYKKVAWKSELYLVNTKINLTGKVTDRWRDRQGECIVNLGLGVEGLQNCDPHISLNISQVQCVWCSIKYLGVFFDKSMQIKENN